ncbi:hypothetical protein CPB84DRAFT_1772659 [Gymnopilus junonius]|uniref:F-box domain-containing protein n=1 Tax=Gymnopilus junonius TaxID=109634 RepID=A0A9P5TQZ1_GYMJU|nr:hypothetical protein CPB84DRAFT_1772659 [Gymnopilus junonius]
MAKLKSICSPLFRTIQPTKYSRKSCDTSQNVETSPIFKLCNDILYLIFMHNLAFDEHFLISKLGYNREHWKSRYWPFITVQTISQVCREWRCFTLDSPFLWANSLNIELLARKKAKWRKKIMKRTRKATLFVQGSVDWEKAYMRTFFLSWLNKFWTRIRVLDVEIRNLPSEDKIPHGLLNRPAPNLEVIYIWSRNSSPCRRLCFPIFPGAHAPWISQLSAIIVSGCHLESCTVNLSSILENTPLLEVLIVDHCTVFHNEKCLQKKITLPKLKLIDLQVDWHSSLVILQGIIPPPCSSLLISFHADDLENAENDADFHVLVDILKLYFVRYFSPGTTTELNILLGLRNNNRMMMETPIMRSPFRLFGQYLNMQVPSLKTIRTKISSLISKCICSCNLTSITILKLEISHFPGYPAWNDDLVTLFLACPSVEVLTADRNVAQILHDLDMRAEQKHIFPKLHTLIVPRGTISSLSFLQECTEMIITFLKRRREVDMPLWMLDLTDCYGNGPECIKYWDGLADVFVWRRRNACQLIPKPPAHPDWACHSCGIARALDSQSGDFTHFQKEFP